MAENFLHLNKAVEGSKEMKGKKVVIISLPFFSLCTRSAWYNSAWCQIRTSRWSEELIQIKIIYIFQMFLWVTSFSAWFTMQLYNGRAHKWGYMTCEFATKIHARLSEA